ncbi:MAG TPA: hypothetical protein PLH94_11415 [Fimbriimonadaceae bacterium]|nr:hypothetical protein [Fimbriimonadaceae bacterium]
MWGKLWKVGLVMILCPVAMWIVSQTMEKRYTAQMKLLIDQTVRGAELPNPYANIDDVITSSRARSVDTQLDILSGSNVLQDAIVKTAEKHPNAFAGAGLGEQFQDLVTRMSFDRSSMSDVLTIRVTMADPVIAADTVNNIGLAYIDYARKLAAEAGEQATTMLTGQVEAAKKRLDEIEGEIAKAKTDLNVADQISSAQAETGTRASVESRAAAAKGDYEGARAEYEAVKSTLDTLAKTVVAADQREVNPILQDIDRQLTVARSRREQLLARYLPDAPAIKESDAEISGLEDLRKKEIATINSGTTTAPNPVRSTVESQLSQAKARMEQTKATWEVAEQTKADWIERTKKYPDLDKKIGILVRERTVLLQNYQELDQRLMLLTSTGKGRQSIANIVSPAFPPQSPSFPNTRLFILFGLGIGVVISAFILMPKGDFDAYGEIRPKQGTLPKGSRRPVQGRANLPAKPGGDAPGGESGNGDKPDEPTNAS